MSAGVYIECPDCSFLLWQGRSVTHNCSHSKVINRLRAKLNDALVEQHQWKQAFDDVYQQLVDAMREIEDLRRAASPLPGDEGRGRT